MEDIKRSGRAALVAAVMLALLFFAQAYTASPEQSLTFDEPGFIGSGYTYLTHSDFRLDPATPPLIQELIALPLLFLDLNVPPYTPHWLEEANPQISYGVRFVFNSGNDVRRISYWARLPIIIAGSLLVLAIFLWGRGLFGDIPALLPTAVAAFSPNLLAHSELATVDIGCTALMFVSVWSFWQATRKGGIRWYLICGLVTGLALLSKYTALLLAPIYLLLAGWLLVRRKPGFNPTQAVKALAVIGGVSFLVVGAGYNFTFDWGKYISGISKIYFDHQPNYHEYLLGHVQKGTFWYYNLVGLATKLPLSAIILIALAAVMCAVDRQSLDTAAFLLVPALMIIVVSFFDKANLGLRRILPAYPFIALFTAHVLAGKRRKYILAAAAVLVCWGAYDAARIYPHHLSYFNVAAGGPDNGLNIFDESNIDWGQDLPALARWQSAHPDAVPLKIMYHGTSWPSAYGVKTVPFDIDAEIEHPVPGYYAMSTHMLVWLRKVHMLNGADIDWLSKYTPVAHAGYSFYIYRFD